MPYLPLLAALAFVLSPLVSGSFGGFDPNAFPVPQDDPPVQPAGWAFAIWGVIYLWLLIHAAFGTFGRPADPAWAGTRAPLTLSLAVGAVWIPVANASPIWATVLILVMLAGALAALLRAGPTDPWLLGVPLGLYAGWLTAASAVSAGLLLAGWGITGQILAAWIALLLALAVGVAVLSRRPFWAYAAALSWALIGIAVQNLGQNPSLIVGPLIGIAALLWIAGRSAGPKI